MSDSVSHSRQEVLFCPKCSGKIQRGKYGLYCKNKCGMNIRRAMGILLNDEQIKDLLQGKKILMKGLISKSGKVYDAYLLPVGIDDYIVEEKDGNKKSGSQYRFRLEFINE